MTYVPTVQIAQNSFVNFATGQIHLIDAIVKINGNIPRQINPKNLEYTSTLMVTFVPPSNKSNIAYYRATTAGQSCKVAADQSPLRCTINGLSGGAPYTVQAVACLENGDCSSPLFGHAFTLPDCK